ncbi:hypothetical protein Pcinc_014316 [Petrolisthes cinctipes]|uniref:Uncharacterized protein n=1 Tax=Petrolisthes cinctipes TaxID=88211 RepID=A0AAE1FVB3_PETCI|nr:hypothetical protein Pcinc_014316 [Petrolisthes cinctipes]
MAAELTDPRESGTRHRLVGEAATEAATSVASPVSPEPTVRGVLPAPSDPSTWFFKWSEGRLCAFSPNPTEPGGVKKRDDVLLKWMTGDDGVQFSPV